MAQVRQPLAVCRPGKGYKLSGYEVCQRFIPLMQLTIIAQLIRQRLRTTVLNRHSTWQREGEREAKKRQGNFSGSLASCRSF
jgi:hypothetical protein